MNAFNNLRMEMKEALTNMWNRISARIEAIEESGGIPGPQGPKGDPGDAAGFGTPTATVDAGTGTPSVAVTASGPDTAKVFAFAFSNLKGATGAQGPAGPQGETGPQGPQGPQGDPATNLITGVKGSAESAYRTGNVNLTPANIGALPDTAIIASSTSIPIPASGASASYSMTGLTSDHELVRWNFSASKENTPPVGLTCTTYNGYFTITNDGGTTSESIRPVFALPTAIAITAR